MAGVDAAVTIKTARRRAGLSLRALARRAGTSHATLRAYETGAKEPGVETLTRIARAAGFEPEVELRPSVAGVDRAARGRELVDALELAAMFPARHEPVLSYPRFPGA